MNETYTEEEKMRLGIKTFDQVTQRVRINYRDNRKMC